MLYNHVPAPPNQNRLKEKFCFSTDGPIKTGIFIGLPVVGYWALERKTVGHARHIIVALVNYWSLKLISQKMPHSMHYVILHEAAHSENDIITKLVSIPLLEDAKSGVQFSS